MAPDGKFWMVYGDGKSAPTVKHDSQYMAEREAERLARAHPGDAFFVLMPVSVSRRVDVETTKLVDLTDLIPF